MQLPEVITIDGPAGAGKSTLGELLARRLGYLYFDTGVMYRALAWAALQRGVNLHDVAVVARLARQLDIQLLADTASDGRQYTVLVDGRDVTWELRAPEVERNVSLAASYPQVREVMRARQREIGSRGGVVMVGRDIGSIVMPDAPLKIYLEASLDERARRRANDLRQRGRALTIEVVRNEVARRDALDQHVLAPAPDAIVLSTDRSSPEEILDQLLAHLEQRSAR